MKSALIGHTGFVGGNIKQQASFSNYYNSKNIEKIKGRKYDVVVSAGTSSLVWKANLEPESDWKQIEKLINSLKKVETNHFILISSIFVYPNPYNVDENTPIDKKNLKQPYGNHRYKLEEFVRKNFKKNTIIRLPNLFGRGLKKNFVFDLIHNNRFDLTHKDSKLQWYNIDYLWKDIQIALEHDLSLTNFAVEPISVWKIARYTLNIKFDTITEKPPVNHNMLTKYASFYKQVKKTTGLPVDELTHNGTKFRYIESLIRYEPERANYSQANLLVKLKDTTAEAVELHKNSQGKYIYYQDQILRELKEFIKKERKLL